MANPAAGGSGRWPYDAIGRIRPGTEERVA